MDNELNSSEDELRLVRQLIVMIKNKCGRQIPESTAIKFLYARKFDISRAFSLYEQHEDTRKREGLIHLDPTKQPLKDELNTEKFTILPERDASGAAIAIFTARIHSPELSSHQTTLQGIVYQLDVALENIETQKAGLIFIYDMSDSKYSNFDYDLSKKILTLLKGGYPAKLKKVLIVTAPLWFKGPFKILRLFVREKLRDRVYTVSIPQLATHISREALPSHLGGTLLTNHAAWLMECGKSNKNIGIATNGGSQTSDIEVDEANGGEICESSVAVPDTWNTEINESFDGDVSPQLATLSSASSGFSDDDSVQDESSRGVAMHTFIDEVLKKGREGLLAEYNTIKNRGTDGTFTNSSLPENLHKNRYTDVLCYDHSRVVLSQIGDDLTSTYINANFVDGYKQRNAFISTQGPLLKTCADFWRMVWEQHVLTIVMTTRVMERDRIKCAQYWPEDEHCDDLVFGTFRVSTKHVDKYKDYVISQLELTNVQTDESRDINHFLFTSWPDFGVPQEAMAIIDFLEKVRARQAATLKELGDKWAGHPKGPPIVVHCSAGIGRTGTFCTLDVSIARLEHSGLVDVSYTVEKIRSQRGFSIQTADQYIFCHVALIEYARHKGMIDECLDMASLLEC